MNPELGVDKNTKLWFPLFFSLASLKGVHRGIDGGGSEVNGAREVNEGLGKFIIKTGSNS